MPEFRTADMNKLESTLAAPQQTFGGMELYPDIADKAAILLYGFAKNHCWNNGNKRAALTATILFCYLNHVRWDAQLEDILGHLRWAATSDAGCFDEAKAYLCRYFRRKLVPR